MTVLWFSGRYWVLHVSPHLRAVGVDIATCAEARNPHTRHRVPIVEERRFQCRVRRENPGLAPAYGRKRLLRRRNRSLHIFLGVSRAQKRSLILRRR